MADDFASGTAPPPAVTAALPLRRSLRALDWTNFLMADVRDGLGPFLAVVLQVGYGWQPGDIGLVMGAGGIAAALSQVPAGWLVDATSRKRLLVAGSGLAIALGSLAIARYPSFAVVLAMQCLLGVAGTVIPPALAALSLGIVGQAGLPHRISRNEAFNHGGNFVAAILAGAVGHELGQTSLFYLLCGFAVASAFAVGAIRPSDVDDDAARGGLPPSAAGGHAPAPVGRLLARRDVLVFLLSIFLFHFGNAAMLPLAGQLLATIRPGMETVALSACIVVAQLVMLVVALAAGRAMRAGISLRAVFLVAFAVLPVRGLLFALVRDPYAVIAVQLLDGISAGIFGVVAVLMAADLTRGTGRFNLMQGLVALVTGLGGALSNVVGGWVLQASGFGPAFLLLAGVSALACAVFAWGGTRRPVAGVVAG